MKQWCSGGLGEAPPAGMGGLLLEGLGNREAAQVMAWQGPGQERRVTVRVRAVSPGGPGLGKTAELQHGKSEAPKRVCLAHTASHRGFGVNKRPGKGCRAGTSGGEAASSLNDHLSGLGQCRGRRGRRPRARVQGAGRGRRIAKGSGSRGRKEGTGRALLGPVHPVCPQGEQPHPCLGAQSTNTGHP